MQIVDGLDLTGTTCVVTGATSGLGRESVRALAAANAHVVLAARNPDALAETRAALATDANITTVELDLTSLASVRVAAARIADLVPAIHVLMNNAGVMFTPFGRTADGFEMQFGTNHLGHFELTRLLTPQLLASGGARVVNLSSDGHGIGDVDLDDPNWHSRDYDKFLAYGASKTANVLHAVELDSRLRDHGVRAFAVHPGVVATALARHMRRADLGALRTLEPEHRVTTDEKIDITQDFVTPEVGAATQVWAATAPELADRGGIYLADCAISDNAAPYATDPHRAAALWTLSEELCA